MARKMKQRSLHLPRSVRRLFPLVGKRKVPYKGRKQLTARVSHHTVRIRELDKGTS